MTDQFMQAAIKEAEKSLAQGGVPIGAVLVHGDTIIGRGYNQRIQKGSAILHGEMAALENAGCLSAAIYKECTMYTTLSPCAMCSGAMILYGIPRVVIGENKTFMGEEQLLKDKGIEITVLNDQTCQDLMTAFIKDHSQIWNEDIGIES
jgi:cytosine/creatinine deaminase